MLLRVALLAQCAALATANIYAGFNYGAFWPNQTGKTYDDFLRQFKLAQNLPNAPVRFDSAHLFTCIQFGTQNEPISAFKAAIDTNTSLLLGLWGPGNETAFTNELSALDNALTQYGKDLSNLIIGVSVGGEDIHRKEAAADDIGQKIQNLKATFSSTLQRSSSYSALFSKPPPIGHSDIVPFATDVKDVDFIGTTVYPYWNNDSIVRAVQSFSESLSQVQSRANGTEIWITETGWPVASQADQGAAKAGVAELQKYWRDVGCTLFGKVNTWWFELEQDTDDHEGINWSIVDPQTGQPRIDLTCGESNQPSNSVASPLSSFPSSSLPPPSGAPLVPAASAIPTPSSAPAPSSPPTLSPSAPPVAQPSPSLDAPTSSEIVIPTINRPLIQPTTSGSSVPTQDPQNPSSTISGGVVFTTVVDGCVTVAEVGGSLTTLATNPPGPDGTCSSPPPFNPPAAIPTSTSIALTPTSSVQNQDSTTTVFYTTTVFVDPTGNSVAPPISALTQDSPTTIYLTTTVLVDASGNTILSGTPLPTAAASAPLDPTAGQSSPGAALPQSASQKLSPGSTASLPGSQGLQSSPGASNLQSASQTLSPGPTAPSSQSHGLQSAFTWPSSHIPAASPSKPLP